MHKREVRLEDGRYLVYYTFEPVPADPAPSSPPESDREPRVSGPKARDE